MINFLRKKKKKIYDKWFLLIFATLVVCFGIGNEFPRGGQVDYVLGKFSEEDMKSMEERISVACDAIKSFCLAGINITMNSYNKK